MRKSPPPPPPPQIPTKTHSDQRQATPRSSTNTQKLLLAKLIMSEAAQPRFVRKHRNVTPLRVKIVKTWTIFLHIIQYQNL